MPHRAEAVSRGAIKLTMPSKAVSRSSGMYKPSISRVHILGWVGAGDGYGHRPRLSRRLTCCPRADYACLPGWSIVWREAWVLVACSEGLGAFAVKIGLPLKKNRAGLGAIRPITPWD